MCGFRLEYTQMNEEPMRKLGSSGVASPKEASPSKGGCYERGYLFC